MSGLLVTGGGGLLGYALKELCPQARFLASRDCDLRDPSQVRELFESAKPRRIIHLAAVVGGVKRNAAQNADLFADNALINVNVLRAAQRAGVSRLVSVLSSCAYPVYSDRPSTEKDLHDGLPFGGNLGYGYAKRMLELQTRLLREQYGCGFSTVSPATLYGPNDNWDLENGHVVGALIHKCFLAKARNGSLEVWGSGRAVRQFAYSYDVARVILALLEAPEPPESLIVVPDGGVTIRDLAHAVAAAVGFQGPVAFDASKPEGQLVRVMRSERFSEIFPDFRFTPLATGLGHAASWFAERHGHALAGTR